MARERRPGRPKSDKQRERTPKKRVSVCLEDAVLEKVNGEVADLDSNPLVPGLTFSRSWVVEQRLKQSYEDYESLRAFHKIAQIIRKNGQTWAPPAGGTARRS